MLVQVQVQSNKTLGKAYYFFNDEWRFEESKSALSTDPVSHLFEDSIPHNPWRYSVLDVPYTNKRRIKVSFERFKSRENQLKE